MRRSGSRKHYQDDGPIIALTADGMSEQIERCFVAGMDEFLAKPSDAAKKEIARR